MSFEDSESNDSFEDVIKRKKHQQHNNHVALDRNDDESTTTVDVNEWALVDLYIKMREWCRDQAVFVMDGCECYDFIDFIKRHT